MKKKVAAIVTEYWHWSHADVIRGKILEGFMHAGKEFPNLELVSMYVDQTPKGDMSKDLAKKHCFTIYDTIDKAVCRGGKELAVDDVLCIGEHGKYPTNERGQLLYPRRRFFEEVAKVFARSNRSVPVFNDKHLAATWAELEVDVRQIARVVRAVPRRFVGASDVSQAGAEVADELRTRGRGSDRLWAVRGL